MNLNKINEKYASKFPISNFKLDGEIYRYDQDKPGDQAIWVLGYEWIYKGNTYYKIIYGSWKSGDRNIIKNYGNDTDANFRKVEHKKTNPMENALQMEKQIRAKECADKWTVLFNQALPDYDHDYLKIKQIPNNLGTRVDSRDTLLIPAYNQDALIGVQMIFRDENGEFQKRFSKGINLRGAYSPLGEWRTSRTIYLAEGFATAASVYMATKKPTICAFNAGNLLHSAISIRAINPNCRIIIVADRDESKTGEIKAKEVCRKLSNCVYRMPNLTGDFNDLHCIEGLPQVSKQLAFDESEFTQIIFLGFDETGTYYFDANKQVIHKISKSQTNEINFLFIANHKYWGNLYGFKKKDGEPTGFCDFKLAIPKILDEQRQIGRFRPDRMRGIGVHLDNKKIIFNNGEKIFTKNEQFSLIDFSKKSKYFYTSERNADIIDAPALTKNQIKDLKSAFKALNTKNKGDHIILLGWIAQAQIFGALDWRAHLWLTGKRGSGKSTILNLIEDLVPLSSQQQGSSPAGIRQFLKSDAMAMIIDEAEPSAAKEKSYVNDLLQMARQCSSRKNAVTMRGTPSGDAYQVTTNSVFCFGSIQISIANDADKSRFFIVELENAKNNWHEVAPKLEKIRHLGPSFFKYMWENFEVLKSKIKQIEQVLSSWDLDQRLKDQIISVVGCYMTLDFDEKISRKHLENVFNAMNLRQNYIAENTIEDESERLIQCILTMTLPVDRSSTVLDELKLCQKDPKRDQKNLEMIGLKWENVPRVLHFRWDNPYLVRHLEQIGVKDIKSILQRHKGAIEGSKPLRLNGNLSRMLSIKMTDLLV